MSQDIVLGIDLGTTMSVISYYDPHEKAVKLIKDKEQKVLFPSVVALVDGKWEVGERALEQYEVTPELTIRNIKRLMGTPFYSDGCKQAKNIISSKVVNMDGMAGVELMGKQYSPEEISSIILSFLKDTAEKHFERLKLDYNISGVVITVPAYFNHNQRTATRRAGEVAGLNVLRIVNEPTAASLAYGLQNKEDGKIVAVDLGGGTFDVSVIDISDSTYKVLSTNGNSYFGGEDLNNKIFKNLVDFIKANIGIDITLSDRSQAILNEEIERVKQELSFNKSSYLNANDIFEKDPYNFSAKITREELEEILDFGEVKKHIIKAIEDADVKYEEIQDVVLVGGSTRIPMLKKIVSKLFDGRELYDKLNPDEVVSIGASIQGAIISGYIDDILLIDVASLSLGIKLDDETFLPIIKKGTVLPAEFNDNVTTSENDQKFLVFNIAQGEAEKFSDNIFLGNFIFEGFDTGPAGYPNITVTIKQNLDGIIEVLVKDENSKAKETYLIEGEYNISQSRIQELTAKNEESNEENKEENERKRCLSRIKYKLFEIERYAEKFDSERMRELYKNGLDAIKEDKLKASDLSVIENYLSSRYFSVMASHQKEIENKLEENARNYAKKLRKKEK